MDRVRACLVSRRWAALLSEPTFWANLDFAGAPRKPSLVADDGDLLLRICRRSAGQLRSLDLSAFARQCRYPDDDAEEEDQPSFFPLLERMAAEGLTARLELLQSYEPEARKGRGRLILCGAEDAMRLCKACPALRSATVRFRGAWRDVAAALQTLSCAGRSAVTIAAHLSPRRLGRRRSSQALETLLRGEFVAFAAALSDALRCCHIESLDLGSVHDDTGDEERPCGYWTNFFGADALFSRAGNPAAAAAAAEQLAGVLASSERGVRRLKILSTPPMPPLLPDGPLSVCFSQLLWGALTPQSPLSELSADGCDGRVSVEALAAALDPARAPGIERIELAGWPMMDTRCEGRE